MLGKKWKPNYATIEEVPAENMSYVEENTTTNDGDVENQKRKKKKIQKLSTKGILSRYKSISSFGLPLPTSLADVVESLIGSAYLHGGFSLNYECIKFGTEVRTTADAERMLGYTFKRKFLLIEALTHASYQSCYQQDSHTPSYERLEFLGDFVLDMIVTDYLYHAPGKIIVRVTMRCSVDALMPRPNAQGRIEETVDTKDIHLWKCLLHSSPKVLEDQQNTATRFRLRPPKFFSDMTESIIGAIFLDSQGNIPVARQTLYNLGIMPILERFVSEDVNVLHPVSRFSLWVQKNGKKIEYVYKREGGRRGVSCVIMVDDKEEIRVADLWKGKMSQEEVKFAAAEDAIRAFKLRDVNVNYSLLKKKVQKSKKE